jgi:predicted DNA-binding protein
MKNGKGRNKAVTGEQRKTIVKLVRLTPDDAGILANVSSSAGKSQAQWIRDAIRGSLEACAAMQRVPPGRTA